jgi:hypothetical protein
VSLRPLLFSSVLFFAASAAACHKSEGQGPGPTPPGQACSHGSDCYCWQCNCAGVTGTPGGGQLCLSGTCPTGEEACTPICAIVDAGLASATSVDTCPGVQ